MDLATPANALIAKENIKINDENGNLTLEKGIFEGLEANTVVVLVLRVSPSD